MILITKSSSSSVVWRICGVLLGAALTPPVESMSEMGSNEFTTCARAQPCTYVYILILRARRFFWSALWGPTEGVALVTRIGTLRSNETTAMRTSLKRWICVLTVFIAQLFVPTYFAKCRRTLLGLISWGPYPSTEREIKFRRCLFTSSTKSEIRHFHVVVVQKRAKKCTKKRGARAKFLSCL